MNMIKTAKRNRMLQKHLNWSMMVRLNTPGTGQLPQDMLKWVVDQFLGGKKRRRCTTKMTIMVFNAGEISAAPTFAQKKNNKRM